jgi:hypothetical protein
MLVFAGCSRPATTVHRSAARASSSSVWRREPIATTSSLACVGEWHDRTWAETSPACGKAFERVGTSWTARPEVYNCYQLIPNNCSAQGEWTSDDGAVFWIRGRARAGQPDVELAGSSGAGELRNIVLDSPAPGAGSARQTMSFTRGDVWGRSRTDVFAVGEHGVILHFDGTTWSPEASHTDADLHAIAGAGADVFVVGTTGTVLHRGTDGSWTREPTPAAVTLRDVAITRDGWFAVGDDGVVLHRDVVTVNAD